MVQAIDLLRQASDVRFDNTTSGLSATGTEGAINETVSRVVSLETLTGAGTNATSLGTFTGGVIGDNVTITAALQSLETYAENITSTVNNFEWQRSALDYVVDNTVAPATEVLGDRYVLSHDGGAPNAAYDGASAGDVVEFDGTVWVAVTPTIGTYIGVDDDASGLYLWGGSSWALKQFEATTASNGLVKVGLDIQLASSAAGAGLGFTSGVLDVNVDDVGVEINADIIRLKDLGVVTAKIADLAVTTGKLNDASVTIAKLGADVNGVGGATAIGVDDSGYTTLSGANLQALGASADTEITNASTRIGSPNATDMGTYTGSTITDNQTVKQNIQELETALEVVSATTGAWSAVTSNTAAVNRGRYAVNTTAGPVIITLPASPAVNDSVVVGDAGRAVSSNSLTVARNGELMQSGTTDFINGTFEGLISEFVFVGGTIGWAIMGA